MSNKLNHSRPYLRYIDNLRRELRREDRPAPHWFDPDRIETFGVRLAEPDKLPTHIAGFATLDPKQQEIAGCAIEAFGEYLGASTAVVSLVISGKAKAKKAANLAQDVALETFVVSGAVLVGTIVDDMAAARPGFWRWFQAFYEGLDRQSKFTWADFGEMLMGDSLQLWFAQQLADTPEGVERWRKYLSTDNWE